MSFTRTALALGLSAAALTLVPFHAGAQEYRPTRSGVVEAIHRSEGGITLDVAISKELAQPTNPELSTGVPAPSQVSDFTNGTTTVVPGMPVNLLIVRSGGTFTPAIGVVLSVPDPGHCVVRVLPKALDQTWQDPADGNGLRKVGRYLKAGAAVIVGGLTNQ